MLGQDLKFVRWNRNLVRVTGYTDAELRSTVNGGTRVTIRFDKEHKEVQAV